MYFIDTRKYDDSFLLAKILEKVDFTDEETKKLFIHFEIPTVDTVKVVRCKDCVHWFKGICSAHVDNIYMDENNFCSLGERNDAID